jgi:hypothetical protein
MKDFQKILHLEKTEIAAFSGYGITPQKQSLSCSGKTQISLATAVSVRENTM